MSDGESLLRAILDEPDEDVHRLVYADWLEENGGAARAEFIRAQCALARFHDEEDPFVTGLPAERLRPELRAAWLAPLISLGVSDWQHPLLFLPPEDFAHCGTVFLFRRGFVEGIRLFGAAGAAQFLPHAAAILERTPLRILSIPPYRIHLQAPSFPRTISPHLLAALLALPRTACLRFLDLRQNWLREEGAAVLLAAPHLRRGIRLRLEQNAITADIREALEARFGSGVSCGEDHDSDIPF
jgi:uncharacterized protein (TIGR02996 family)